MNSLISCGWFDIFPKVKGLPSDLLMMMLPDAGEKKLNLASAETLFSPAQKSIDELKGAINLEQFKRLESLFLQMEYQKIDL